MKELTEEATLRRKFRTIRLHSPTLAIHNSARSRAARFEGTKTTPEEAVSAEPTSNTMGKDTCAIALRPGISNVRVDELLCPIDTYHATTTT